MARRDKKKRTPEGGLWIAPNYKLKGPDGERAWDGRVGGPPSQTRFLEFADIAMGLKKAVNKKKQKAIHQKTKDEPYSP